MKERIFMLCNDGGCLSKHEKIEKCGMFLCVRFFDEHGSLKSGGKIYDDLH